MTSCLLIFFFFNDTATTEIYTLSLHDALPIWRDEVVQVLAERGEPGEKRVAEDRQQDVLAEQHHQARDAEHAEADGRSEEHTSELQSHSDLVCRLLLEKKKRWTCAQAP